MRIWLVSVPSRGLRLINCSISLIRTSSTGSSFRPLAGIKAHQPHRLEVTQMDRRQESFRPLAGIKAHQQDLRVLLISQIRNISFRPLAGIKAHQLSGHSRACMAKWKDLIFKMRKAELAVHILPLPPPLPRQSRSQFTRRRRFAPPCSLRAHQKPLHRNCRQSYRFSSYHRGHNIVGRTLGALPRP